MLPPWLEHCGPATHLLCRRRAKNIFQRAVHIYEDLLVSQGVDAKVLGEEEALDHHEILRSYRKANLSLKVCPGCDGDPPLSVSTHYHPRPDGKLHHALWLNANIDHFLPKSKYPCLAVHPLNPVPLCTVCNQVRKGDKDPPVRLHPAVGVSRADARLHGLEHVLGLQKYWDGDLQDERLEI